MYICIYCYEPTEYPSHCNNCGAIGHMFMPGSWLSNSSEEDLYYIPVMLSHGFTPHFHWKDVWKQRIYPNYIPARTVWFSKGNRHVWFIEPYWCTGIWCDGTINNIKRHTSIEELLKTVDNDQIRLCI